MNKLIYLIILILLLSGCSSILHSNEEQQIDKIPEYNQSWSVQNGQSMVLDNNRNNKNDSIEEFLEIEFTGTSLEEVELPTDSQEIISKCVDFDLNKMDYDIEIIPFDYEGDLAGKMSVVTANRVALISLLSPYMDNSTSYSTLDIAEQLLGENITWARDTGRINYENGANKLYTIMKSETGGYVYIFFEKLYDSYRLKFIIYVDEIYNKNEFSNINIGDSMEVVANIDTSTALYYKEGGPYYLRKFYYLEDSVLLIEYDESKTIINITETGYEFPNFITKLRDDRSRAYDITILLQDYPPAS